MKQQLQDFMVLDVPTDIIQYIHARAIMNERSFNDIALEILTDAYNDQIFIKEQDD